MDDVRTDVDRAVMGARKSAGHAAMRDPTRRAGLLRAIAAGLDAERARILETASEETALTLDELTPEFARMTGTLRMFAELIEEGSWVRAAIDTRVAEGDGRAAIGPNHDVRRMLVPLGGGEGVVAVFGSSNFPLAYGVCGGDTASALAAGCAVVVKEHPAHPKTGRLIANVARSAIGSFEASASEAGSNTHYCAEPLPGVLQYLHNDDPSDFSVAQTLLQHHFVTAAGFTGSTVGGRALQKLCMDRERPIPIFAEMGSLNAVFVCRHAFKNRGSAIADELAASVLARVGQQCTKPGVVFVAGEEEHVKLYEMIKQRLLEHTPRRMLAPTVWESYYRRLELVAESPDVVEHSPLPSSEQRRAGLGVPVVFRSSDAWMENDEELWEETFGPAIIVAWHRGSAESFLRGALAQTVYADAADLKDVGGRARCMDSFHPGSAHLACAGRIIYDGVPTGVRVAHGMVHGGPFPATNRPESTAVGPYAIERWCRPVCWQNCPDALLPDELKDANPRGRGGIWRMVNGEWTKAAITR